MPGRLAGKSVSAPAPAGAWARHRTDVRPRGRLRLAAGGRDQSAGRSKAAATGKGNPWLGGTLGEAATSAARTKTFLASRYKRIVRRRGKQRALVAVGNSLLTIAWHLPSDPAAHFTDLGPDWHDRLAPLRRKHQLIAELERLSGKKVTLHDTA